VTTAIPYGRQFIQEDDIEAVVKVLRSDWLTTGPVVDRFEKALAEKLGAKYAVVVSNGTAALHLACLAAGVGSGDVVISSPNTFAASTNCALYCGARPAFVDIDRRSYNLDPKTLSAFLSRRDSDGTLKAVIPVHFAGQPCDMEEISRIARQEHLVIIEDACHALGARWQDSQSQWHQIGSCSHSDIAVLSFHPVKHITTGEGGAILTNDVVLYDKVKRLRNHGITRDAAANNGNGAWYYELRDLGFNYRLTDFQCALGISQLNKLDSWIERRREIAATYDRLFGSLEHVGIPYEAKNARSSYHLYVIRVNSRLRVFENLQKKGIGVQVHYIPVHLHQVYRERFGFRAGDFPLAEDYYDHAISLPIFPLMSDADVLRVVEEVKVATEKQ
jgi:UDP-4-amino-4,6-dideoxy-N-acetyl-beta-L-altrosamine transaminase